MKIFHLKDADDIESATWFEDPWFGEYYEYKYYIHSSIYKHMYAAFNPVTRETAQRMSIGDSHWKSAMPRRMSRTSKVVTNQRTIAENHGDPSLEG